MRLLQSDTTELEPSFMSVFYRRVLFGSLVGLTIAVLTSLMAILFSANGLSAGELVLLACFLITLPWTAIGFWNAVIGFALMRLSSDPARHVFPASASITGEEDINSSTAVAMCIRNEDVDQVARNLNAMIARLVASGQADKFHVYVLSDTDVPETAEEEETRFADLKQRWAGKIGVTYRRREENPGFKAGNIRDFCLRWGDHHDFMLTLDADSVMSASTVLRLVRIMQKNRDLGILQSLVVGLPSDSAFTRVFQFGMRMGMRSYTLGSAWWQADCGPYWGHNALIRLKPFIESCHLPQLSGDGPLSGWILSHDQVEAVYMRRAGFECRVLAEETGSYEENPPHILEFIRRDLRWCHGNMQYFKLLGERDLMPTSRVQLFLAILMFASSPAWMTFVTVATAALYFPTLVDLQMINGNLGYWIFGIIMTMIFAPKIASILDVLLTRERRADYGGVAPVIASSILEIAFSMMLAPIMAIANTIFLFKLFVLRKAKGWVSQSRKAEALPFGVTASHLWPQMLFGLVGFTVIFSGMKVDWFAVAMCVPVFVGPLFAIPFGLSSSHIGVGRLAARVGLWQLPEEGLPPVIIRALHLTAVAERGAGLGAASSDHNPLSTEELLDMGMEVEYSPAAKRSGRFAA